jgi:hypothetical protein
LESESELTRRPWQQKVIQETIQGVITAQLGEDLMNKYETEICNRIQAGNESVEDIVRRYELRALVEDFESRFGEQHEENIIIPAVDEREDMSLDELEDEHKELQLVEEILEWGSAEGITVPSVADLQETLIQDMLNSSTGADVLTRIQEGSSVEQDVQYFQIVEQLGSVEQAEDYYSQSTAQLEEATEEVVKEEAAGEAAAEEADTGEVEAVLA